MSPQEKTEKIVVLRGVVFRGKDEPKNKLLVATVSEARLLCGMNRARPFDPDTDIVKDGIVVEQKEKKDDGKK